MGRNIGTLQKVPLKIDDEDDFDNASQNKRPRHQDPHKQHSQHNPYDRDDDNDDEIKVSLTKQRSASKYFLITPEMNVQKIIAIFFCFHFFYLGNWRSRVRWDQSSKICSNMHPRYHDCYIWGDSYNHTGIDVLFDSEFQPG